MKPWEQFSQPAEDTPPWEQFASVGPESVPEAPWEQYGGEVASAEEVPAEAPSEPLSAMDRLHLALQEVPSREPTQEELDATYSGETLSGGAEITAVPETEGETLGEFFGENDLIQLGQFLRRWATTPEDQWQEQRDLQDILEEQASQDIKQAAIDQAIEEQFGTPNVSQRLRDLEDTAMIRRGGLTEEEQAEYEQLSSYYNPMVEELSKLYDQQIEEQGSISGVLTSVKDAFVEDPLGTTGEFVKEIIRNPQYALIPAGWSRTSALAGNLTSRVTQNTLVNTLARGTGGGAGVSTLGAGVGAFESIVDDLTHGRSVDTDKALTQAGVGAIASAGVITPFKAVKPSVAGLHNARLNLMAKRYRQRYERTYYQHRQSGLSASESRRRTRAEVGLSDADFGRVVARAGKPNLSDTYVPQATNKMWEAISTGGTIARDKMRWLAGLTKTNLDLKSPEAGALMRRSLFEPMRETSDLVKKYEPYKDLRRVINSPEITSAMLNGEASKLQRIADNLPEATGSRLMEFYRLARKDLDGFIAKTKEVGAELNVTENFWPRNVRSYDKLLAKMGLEKVSNSAKRIRADLAEAIRKKTGDGSITPRNLRDSDINTHLTSLEVAKVVNRYTKSTGITQTVNESSSHLKSRSLETVSRELVSEYLGAYDSLIDYFNTMPRMIATRRVFGGPLDSFADDIKKAIDSGTTPANTGSLGELLARLSKEGRINIADIDDITSLYKSVFVKGFRAPNKVIGTIRDLTYTMLLGNPLAAATQLGDIGPVAAINGISNTAVGIGNALRRTAAGAKGTVDDLGVDTLIKEADTLALPRRVMEWSFKWGMFHAVDKLGKEVAINSSLRRILVQTRTDKGRQAFTQKYGPTFSPEEMGRLMDQLDVIRRDGVAALRDDAGALPFETRLMLFNELADLQPIALSEFPPAYLEHPNLRIFYMLKSYLLKQIDIVRRRSYQQISQGNWAAGVKNLMMLGFFISMSNTGVEVAKSAMMGKDYELSDVAVWSLLRNYGLREGILDQVADGKFGTAGISLLTPPVAVPLDANSYTRLDKLPILGPYIQMLKGSD